MFNTLGSSFIALFNSPAWYKPWLEHSFIDKIIKLQKKRHVSGQSLGQRVQFYDCLQNLATKAMMEAAADTKSHF